ncbi:SRPBCC domain-containing protein [Emticicia sp. 21SJ11W-3]|uniref:SRPBCC family protein n=1 Tax=Emticicia sp. 21SJ11W-3 TaxID=2916755 RepID=UPI00209DB889|nr:SRPBCC domain-containing protein [Emticicia sp. 21SJ11W-3]UTA69353.1 SRPBCC domain-containing protein [Emticicia sp. 21SJ11W-3]
MKVISKSIEIAAPKERIWDVLLQDKYGRIWMDIFSPGSHALTDWELGGKVIFTDGSGGGIFGRIIIKEPYKIISVEYDGLLKNNLEDTTSEEAKPWIGTHETYRLTEKETITLLEIESDMIDDYYDMMAEHWDKALLKIEELATSA